MPSSAYAPNSSGDLALDRRYQWAIGSLEANDIGTALDLLRGLVDMAPDWRLAWFALGQAQEAFGDADAAIQAFEQARRLDPSDLLGAELRIARLRGSHGDKQPAAAHIGALFDRYAATFERHLIDNLGYRAPDLLYAAVWQTLGGSIPKFEYALDLGCGTGLAGRRFAAHCTRLRGVDLSPQMIAQARATKIYESLEVDDLLRFLERCETAHVDLAIAADVLVYFDSLIPCFCAVGRVLKRGGLFALSLQRSEAGVILGEELRFSHSRDAVAEAAGAACMKIRVLDPLSTRRERGVDAPGWVAVLERL